VYTGLAITSAPDDNLLFSSALSGHVEFIISGDAKVQVVKEYQGIRVLSPLVFLALLQL
jgi:predicted nucleic acid-binding protein